MTDLTKGYTVKSNATRGAKRMGLVNFVIETREDGLHYIVPAMRITEIHTDTATGAVTLDVQSAEGEPLKGEWHAAADSASEPQPPLSTETAAAVNKLHGMAHADLAKLAKSLGAPVASSNEEIQQRRAARRAEKGIPEPVPVTNTKLPSYKDMSAATSGRKSDIEKPVAVVHAYLRENWGTKSRKALIADLVAKGINISTCRTQYQIVKGRIEAERAAAALETKV